jgi:hypothetical protein
MHRPAWQVQLVSPSGSRLIGPHESAVPSTGQKLCIDQRTEQRIACGAVEAPEPLCLRRRQPQSGHLDVLALDASQNVVKRLLCWHLRDSPFPISVGGRKRKSNAHATAAQVRTALCMLRIASENHRFRVTTLRRFRRARVLGHQNPV